MKIQDLTISERIILAERLWDSVVDEDAPIELTAPQERELERRLNSFLADHDHGSTWAEVKERIISK